jgi:hypothetical protein
MRPIRCLAVGIVGIALACGGVDYSKIMIQKISAALGEDFSRYQAFSYPTNNFGLGTIYIVPGTDAKMDDQDFECDTWECIGKADSIPPDPTVEREMAGYAAVGKGGGAISLDEKTKTDIALNVILPEVYEVLKVGGGYEKSKVVDVALEIGQAFPRKLRRARMSAYLSGLPHSSALWRAFDQGDLVVVVADVIVDRFKVTIDVDQSSKASLDAAIAAPVPQLKLGKDAKVNVALQKDVAGKYVFDVSRPVIIARLAKHQPAGGVLGAQDDNDFSDWIPVKTASTFRLPR